MKYIIVGLGNFGASLAEKLTSQGNEVIGIDTSRITSYNVCYTKLLRTETFNIDAKKEELISETELNRISFLTTPNKALAVFKIPRPKAIDFSKLIVALDDVRDPGNLGTIIRLCDWFGIKNLVCSQETVA